jgi:inward rectifier potassium channel
MSKPASSRPALPGLDPSGRANVVRLGPKRRRTDDLYHSLLQLSWLRLLCLLVLGFLLLNTLFGLGYWLGGPQALEGAQPGSFADAFYFSVQTMATIGYGKMAPASTLAHLLVTVEALVGLLGFATATGLVFAKLSRPTARVLFSQKVVHTRWQGEPSLMVRMANERSNQIVEAQCNLALLRDETTADGQSYRRVYDLPLLRSRTPVFALTWTAIHPITPQSPLFGATSESLARCEAGLVITFTGIDETFSQTVHARQSWSTSQIVFGHHFADVFLWLPDGRRAMDLSRFHQTEPDPSVGDQPR